MTTELPSDLLAFLRAGRELRYDISLSQVGRVSLKPISALMPTRISTFPGSQSIIDDPYEDVDGHYQIDVFDLVAESEAYLCEGLLCYIVTLKQFGSVDPEHGDVITFPGITWTEIAANPLQYLDAQWTDSPDAVRVLPWRTFPFKLTEDRGTFMPYGSQCPVHESDLIVRRVERAPLLGVMRRRDMEGWIQNYTAKFPCVGVPVAQDQLICCADCRMAEADWLQEAIASVPSVRGVPTVHGWVKCPGCGVRFSLSDANVYCDGFHMKCGERIEVIA